MQRKMLLGTICFTFIFASGCENKSDKKSKAEKKSPAKVESLPKETNLAKIQLTQKASERLGITLEKVTRKKVTQVRNLGGEVMIPPGEMAAVVAPVSGTVQLPEKATFPKPGSSVEKDQPIFKFVPLLTPERFVPTQAERAQIANAQATLISLQMQADGDTKQFAEEVAAAKIELNRAVKLLEDRVGSKRAVDDAKAKLAIAEARYKVALERKKILDKLSTEIKKGSVSPVTIKSPIKGILRKLPVTLGQTVSTGTILFEVVNLDDMWIRVPVYVGLLNKLNLDKDVTITILGENNKKSHFKASPIKAPPAADPLSSTADLYYRISNKSGRFRPGERVSVTLSMNSLSEAAVIPSKAVLYDIHGSTWVYTKVGDFQFQRERISVIQTTRDYAVLKSGPEEGTEIVVDGAAELFGTEFGTGK